MHYYQFNIADYRKDTAHLSPLEHHIYRWLMDTYYLSEEPIPKETQSVLRRLGLGTEGLESLNCVLSDFFVLLENEWHHKRIDLEIVAYRAKSKQNRENGQKGGRPKKQSLTKDKEPKKTQSVNSDNPTKSELNLNQEPLTTNQKPLTTESKHTSNSPKGIAPCPTQKIVDLYHEKLPELPQLRVMTDARKKHINSRWKEIPEIGLWEQFFDRVAASKFLTGRVSSRDPNRKPFKADLAWLVKPENFAKVLESKYE